jgi:hypothetical protein
MNERHPARRHRVSARDRQMLVAAYSPVMAFAVVVMVARFSDTRRHQLPSVLR